jgi:tetratricopeptide (TPR) repeat protein
VLGKRIREVRLNLGLSQRQVAGKEMTRAFISLVEAGKAAPAMNTLRLIAQRLGKPVEYFLTDGLEDSDAADVGALLLETAAKRANASQYESALNLTEQARRIGLSTYLTAQAASLALTCLRRMGRYEEALQQCDLAIDTFLEVGDRHGVATSYLAMGSMLFHLEEFVRARRAFEQATIYSSEQKRHKETHADALTYLGTTLIRLGNVTDATRVYQEAFDICSWMGDKLRAGSIAMGLGKCLQRVGDIETAYSWTHQAIILLTESGSWELVLAEHNLAVIEMALGRVEESLVIYARCLETYKARGAPDLQASVLEELALYRTQQDDLNWAEECCRQALELLDVKDDGVIRARIYRVLGTVKEKRGALDEAYLAFRMSYDLLRRLKCADEAAVTLRALERVRTAKRTATAAKSTSGDLAP